MDGRLPAMNLQRKKSKRSVSTRGHYDRMCVPFVSTVRVSPTSSQRVETGKTAATEEARCTSTKVVPWYLVLLFGCLSRREGPSVMYYTVVCVE